jgi:hypothetical protein
MVLPRPYRVLPPTPLITRRRHPPSSAMGVYPHGIGVSTRTRTVIEVAKPHRESCGNASLLKELRRWRMVDVRECLASSGAHQAPSLVRSQR